MRSISYFRKTEKRENTTLYLIVLPQRYCFSVNCKSTVSLLKRGSTFCAFGHLSRKSCRFVSENESLDYEVVVEEYFETVFACCFKISTQKTKLPLGYMLLLSASIDAETPRICLHSIVLNLKKGTWLIIIHLIQMPLYGGIP